MKGHLSSPFQLSYTVTATEANSKHSCLTCRQVHYNSKQSFPKRLLTSVPAIIEHYKALTNNTSYDTTQDLTAFLNWFCVMS